MLQIDKNIVSVELYTPPAEHPLPKREEVLSGKTYKLKPPNVDHAIYVTINNNAEGHPYEIFINSKNMDHYQWMAALTRIISALFRKGGSFNFLVDELKSVFDPNGGYFGKGHYVPSLVAGIGEILEQHMGLVDKEPRKGAPCPKCGESMVRQEGCTSCPACGYSKCG